MCLNKNEVYDFSGLTVLQKDSKTDIELGKSFLWGFLLDFCFHLMPS